MTLSCSCTALLMGGCMSGFEPSVPWCIQFPHMHQPPNCKVHLALPFPLRPSVARAVEEGTSVFCDGYDHPFYPGPLLGSGGRIVLHGGKHTEAWLVTASCLIIIKSPLCHAHRDSGCKAPASSTDTPPRHGGYTNGEEQRWPQFEQEQLWLLNSELGAQLQSIWATPNTATFCAGLDGREAGGRVQWPSPAKMAAPRVIQWQKSRFLKRFLEGPYKKRNPSP